MIDRPERWAAWIRHLAPAIAGVALLLIVATPVLTPSKGALEGGQPSDASAFVSGARETGYDVRSTVTGPTQAMGLAEETALIVLPDADASLLAPSAQALEAWWASSGGLVIADGEGGASAVLDALDVPTRSTRILDASLSEDPTRVPADAAIDGETYRVVLHQPLSLDPDALEDSEWEPVGHTLGSSFNDANGNGQLDRSDPRGPFPVAAARDRGVVLTSGHVFSNEAAEQEQTAQAVTALTASLLPGGGTIVVDTSHAEHGLGGDVALTLLRPPVALAASPLWGALLVVGVGGGTGLLLFHRSRELRDWSAERSDPSEVVREGASLDVAFMAKGLDSLLDERGADSVPSRYRDLLDSIQDTEAVNGVSEE